MRRISFTKHADVKLELLKRHGFCVEQNFIENCVNAPDKVEKGYEIGRASCRERV